MYSKPASASSSRSAYKEKLVWTKRRGKWWSAAIVDQEATGFIKETFSIFIYGINVVSEINRTECIDFMDGFESIVKAQVDTMEENWTIGVVEALRELYKNDPSCINYDLKALANKGLVKTPKRCNYESDDAVPPKKRYTSTLNLEQSFEAGSLVWAKYGEQWWSGIIIEKVQEDALDKKYVVFWMSDQSISEISNKKVIDFVDNFVEVLCAASKKMTKLWQKGIVKALQELYNYEVSFENTDLLQLASQGLVNIPQRKNCVPVWIRNILKNYDDPDKLDLTDKKADCSTTLKEVIGNKLKTKEILDKTCLGCYTTNGAEFEHPLFKGHVCSKCLVRLKRTMIVKGDDGLHYYCAVCGTLGLMILCDVDYCGRAYCFQCISDLTAKNTWNILKTTKKWLCFLCEESSIQTIIYGREDFSVRIHQLYTPEKLQLVNAPSKPLASGKKLRVLSLFDGISTGFYSLQKLNISVEAYYASEIDVAAISISKSHFGDKIIQIGDVTNITERTIKEISPIHLLIGGSPCNELSLVNHARKGLYDCKGSGVLFFEFFRIILLLKKYNKNGFYWLYENVACMQLNYRQTISLHLQCEPVLKDAVLVSPQHRPRLFWGNLPSLYVAIPFEETNLQDVLMPGRTALTSKLKTVTTKSNSLRLGKHAIRPVLSAQNTPDTIWITELEQVFGLPPHYTDAGNMSATQRQQAIGKAWSIPVIMHLFNFLHNFCNNSSPQTIE